MENVVSEESRSDKVIIIRKSEASTGGTPNNRQQNRTPISEKINEETFSSSSSSDDSVHSSGAATIVNSVRILLEQPYVEKSLTATGEEMTTDTRLKEDKPPPAVTSPTQVRQYKNSPFGLNRHYLTMPDSESGPNNFDFDLGADEDDDDEDSATETAAIKRSKQRDSTKVSKKSRRGDKRHRTGNKRSNPLTSSSSQHSFDDFGKSVTADQDSIPGLPVHHLAVGSGWGHGEPAHHNIQHDTNNEYIHSKEAAAADATKCCETNKCPTECIGDDADFYRCEPNDLSKKHHYPQHKKNSNHQEANSLLVKFSSIMYATFLVILGCILHVSELRQKSKNSSDHIYTTIVALVGVIWLLFLQADLHRYKRYASKYILIETIFNDHRQKDLEAQRQGSSTHNASQQVQSNNHDAILPPPTRSTTSSSASLVNGDKLSMNTEVIFKKTAYKMYQQRAAAMNNHRLRANSKLSHSSSSHSDATNQYDWKQGKFEANARTAYEHENLVPAYKFLHGKMGANFYLKCGMAAFCFGHVIHEGLRFGQQLYFFGTGNTHCSDSAALIAHLITPLYSFYQLFMMFKYSNLVINRHKVLARFGLMHIIGTSVTFWFRTILEEAFEDFVHKMDYFKTNKPHINLALIPNAISSEPSNHLISLLTSITDAIKAEASERSEWSVAATTTAATAAISRQSTPTNATTTMAQSLLTLMSSPISATITPQIVRHLPDSYACAQNTLLTTRSMNALPYLYPFTIEYNLLLAATFLSLYFNIGKIGVPGAACKPSLMHYSNMMPKPKRNMNIEPGSYYGGSNVESSDNNSSATRMHDGQGKEIGEFKSNFVVNADCHSANKGLFCGFFVLLVTIITIVIFFVTINKPSHIQLGIKINLIQEAMLTTFILIVTIAGFKQIVKLNRNPYLKDKVTTDDVLMLIPLPFFFIHSLLSFRAETASMSAGSVSAFLSFLLHGGNRPQNTTNESFKISLLNSTSTSNSSRLAINNLLLRNGTHSRLLDDLIAVNASGTSARNLTNVKAAARIIGAGVDSSHIDHFKLITVVLNIVVMIEVLVQTNFIIDGMRRCSETRYLRFKKPGRELITFAILLNITYWIVATFETKSVEQYKTEIEYYGPLPYMFISHTTLPVMLFYRYHSSVCLAEIWNRAYKPPKKR